MKHKPYKLGLHWIRHDLRLNDNEALHTLAETCEQVVAVYVFDPKCLALNKYGHCHLGKHRRTFLDQGLSSLKTMLNKINIDFYMLNGDPVNSITELVKNNSINCISYENHYGFNEQNQIGHLRASLPDRHFIEGQSHYLMVHNELPFELADMPDVFSPFRRKVEKHLFIREPITKTLSQSPAVNKAAFNLQSLQSYKPTTLSSDNGYLGGETSAQSRIQDYFFNTDGIATYKETRNGLDGWDFSSRFSAYLAAGFVSPSFVYKHLKKYEEQRVKNDSTYWLFFELLWREFFHLQAKKQGVLFFSFGGIQNKPPVVKHNNTSFEQWKHGTTPYSIVNAAMKQLAATGFMSNRARQLVASCFVHELGLDWRYGAAYFEEMLIDFDVASNYGNWQYLAGVGSDPRGHRQFNLAKQTQIYDPNGDFINKWQ
ncbi:MAG: deoxyribodipyrimidine photo-lyase [Alphaproteobacteria bacterium]|jgi:deoxyribodipyrimidine photo-lyase